MAFSSNGQWLAAGSEEGRVQLWEVGNLNRVPRLFSQEGPIRSLAFSPDKDSCWLATAGTDKKVRLWNLADLNQPPCTFIGHTSSVTSVTFSPDGQWLASGSHDRTVRLWNPADPSQPPLLFTGHTSIVASVAFSPDSRRLISGGDDHTVRLWNRHNLSEAPRLLPRDVYEGRVTSMASARSADNQWLAIASLDGTVQLWDLADSSQAPRIFYSDADGVAGVALSSDGHWLASNSYSKRDDGSYGDCTVWLWNLADPSQAPRIFTGHTGSTKSLAFSPNGRWLASANSGIPVWDVLDPSRPPRILMPENTGWVWSVAFSSNSRWLASTNENMTVQLWDVASGRRLGEIQGFSNKIKDIAWHATAEGHWLLTGGEDYAVRLWQIKEAGDQLQAMLHWTSTQNILTASNANIQNVEGLSEANIQLFTQRGAMGTAAFLSSASSLLSHSPTIGQLV